MTVLAIDNPRVELRNLAELVATRKADCGRMCAEVLPLLVPAVLPTDEARRLFVLLVEAVGEALECRADPGLYAEERALSVRLAGRVLAGLDGNVAGLLDCLAASA